EYARGNRLYEGAGRPRFLKSMAAGPACNSFLPGTFSRGRSIAMDLSSYVWLIALTVGVVLLGAAMSFGLMRNRERTLPEKVLTEVETRREYQREGIDPQVTPAKGGPPPGHPVGGRPDGSVGAWLYATSPLVSSSACRSNRRR